MLWIFNEFFFLNFRVTLTHVMSEIVTWLAWMIWTVRNPMFRMYKLPIWMIWLKLELLVCMKTKEGEKFTNILSKVNLYCFSTLYKALYKPPISLIQHSWILNRIFKYTMMFKILWSFFGFECMIEKKYWVLPLVVFKY